MPIHVPKKEEPYPELQTEVILQHGQKVWDRVQSNANAIRVLLPEDEDHMFE